MINKKIKKVQTWLAVLLVMLPFAGVQAQISVANGTVIYGAQFTNASKPAANIPVRNWGGCYGNNNFVPGRLDDGSKVINAGDWLEFSINVTAATEGTYTISTYTGGAWGGTHRISVSLNGAAIATNSDPVWNTCTGWGGSGPTTIPAITLCAGKTYILRVTFVDGDVGLHQITFERTGSEGCIDCTAPASVAITGNQSYCQHAAATALNAVVSGGTPVDYTYRWYSNTSHTNTGGTVIEGASHSTFTPPTDVAGAFYYYCEVSTGGANCVAKSAAYAVTVNAAPQAIVTYTAGTTYADLNWMPVAGSTGYKVYRCTDNSCANRTLLTTSPLAAGATSYRISGAPSTDYYVVETLFSTACASLSNVVSHQELPTADCSASGCPNQVVGYIDFSYNGGTPPARWQLNEVTKAGAVGAGNQTLTTAYTYNGTANLTADGSYTIVRNPAAITGGKSGAGYQEPDGTGAKPLQNIEGLNGIFLARRNGNTPVTYSIGGLHSTQTADVGSNKLNYCLEIVLRNVGTPSNEEIVWGGVCNDYGNNFTVTVKNRGIGTNAALSNSTYTYTNDGYCNPHSGSGNWTNGNQINAGLLRFGDRIVLKTTVTLAAIDGFDVSLLLPAPDNARNHVYGIESITVSGCTLNPPAPSSVLQVFNGTKEIQPDETLCINCYGSEMEIPFMLHNTGEGTLTLADIETVGCNIAGETGLAILSGSSAEVKLRIDCILQHNGGSYMIIKSDSAGNPSFRINFDITNK